MTTTSAPASWTSSAVAAPIPVAPPTTRARFPSNRNASNSDMYLSPWFLCGGSGDDAADLEVHDGIPVEADRLQDLVAVLVEVGRPPELRLLLVELDRRGDELERRPVGVHRLLDVAVGDRLRVLGDL